MSWKKLTLQLQRPNLTQASLLTGKQLLLPLLTSNDLILYNTNHINLLNLRLFD